MADNDLVELLPARMRVLHCEMQTVSRLQVDDARGAVGVSAPSKRRQPSGAGQNSASY